MADQPRQDTLDLDVNADEEKVKAAPPPAPVAGLSVGGASAAAAEKIQKASEPSPEPAGDIGPPSATLVAPEIEAGTPASPQKPVPAPEPDYLKRGGRADIARKAVEEANPEGGKLPTDPEDNPFDMAFMGAMAEGHSWKDITDHVTAAREAAIDAGHSADEVDAYLGFNDKNRLLYGRGPKPEPGIDARGEYAADPQASLELAQTAARYAAAGFTHPVDLVSGLEMSSGGMAVRDLLLRQKNVGAPIEPTDNSPEALDAQRLGQMLGDQVTFGAIAGVGTLLGSPFGGLASGAVIPAWTRAYYVDQLKNGPYLNTGDFARRTVADIWEGTKEAVPTLAASLLVGPAASSLGAGSLLRVGAEFGALTSLSSAISGQLPTFQDLLEAGVQVAVMHGVSKIPGAMATIKENITRNYIETGMLPKDQVLKAHENPAFSQSLVTPPRAPAIPGSSTTPAGTHGDFVVSRNYATIANMGDPHTPGWQEANLTTIKSPSGETWEVNKQGAAAFEGLVKDLELNGIKVKSSGGYNLRDIRGEPGVLSQHAFGNAIDINAEEQPQGGTTSVVPPQLARRLAEKWGMTWGGDWHGSTYDPMHFQWNGPGSAATPGIVPDHLFRTVKELESSGGTDASTRVPNKAGALGIMQITRETAKDYGIDYDRLAHDDAYSDAAGRRILEDLSKKYQGETDAMLIGYNAGPGMADRWIAGGRNNAMLPIETQKYLIKAHNMGELPARAAISGDVEKTYTDGLKTATIEMETRIEERANGDDTWAPKDGIDPIETAYQDAKKAAFDEAMTDGATRYAATLPADEMPAAKAAYNDGQEAFATDIPVVLGRMSEEAYRKGFEEAKAQSTSISITGFPPRQDTLAEVPHTVPIPREAPAEEVLEPTSAFTGHAGAGAATPGFVESKAAPYVPPTYKEASEAIAGTIKDERVPTTAEGLKTFLSKAYRETLRPDHPLNKIQEAYEQGKTLKDLNNPKILRQMAKLSSDYADYGVNVDQIDLKGNVVGPSFKKIIAPLKTPADTAAFEVYSKSRWAMEKAEQAKETGIAYDAAKVIVENDTARFGTMFDQLVGFRNNSLAYLRDANIISKSDYARWVEENKAGVPGYRIDDERVRNSGQGGPGLQSRNPVKEMIGSKLPTGAVLKAVLQDHFSRTSLALRNRANIAITDMTREMGLSGAAPSKLLHVELTDAEIRKLGVDPEAETAFYRKLNANLGPNDMVVFRDGKATVEHFDDPVTAEALKGMSHPLLNVMQKLTAPLNRIARGGSALNPLFPIRNLIYDVGQRTIQQGFRQSFGSFYEGVKMAVGANPEMWNRWMKSGGSDYARAYLDTPYYKDVLAGKIDTPLGSRVWNAVTSPLTGLQAYGRVIMSTMPAGRFAYGVKNLGESDIRAGAASSEFKLHSPLYGGPAGKAINTQVPFLLAHMNGMEQNLRGALGLGKSTSVISEGGDKSQLQRALSFNLRALAVVTAPMLTNWLLSKDEDWYKAAPDWQKNNGLLFHAGGATFYVPLPPLLGLIYGGIPRMLADKFLGDNPNAFAHGFQDIAGALIPPGAGFLGGALATASQLISNHSFLTGRPIVPDDVTRNRLGPEQAVPWSSQVAKKTSLLLEHIGLSTSPEKIDFAIQGFTGTLGKEVTKGIDKVSGWISPDPNKPGEKWTDFPGVSSFFVRYPSASSQPTTDFMEKAQVLDQTHGSIEAALKAGDVNRAIEVLNQPGGWVKALKMQREAKVETNAAISPADLARWSQAYTKALSGRTPEEIQAARDYTVATKAITVARNVVKAIGVNRQMSNDDKQQNIDAALKNMQGWSERGLKALDKLGL